MAANSIVFSYIRLQVPYSALLRPGLIHIVANSITCTFVRLHLDEAPLLIQVAT